MSQSLNSIYDNDDDYTYSYRYNHQANTCPKYNINNKSTETLSDKLKIGCIIDTASDDPYSESEIKTKQIEITLQLGLYNPKPNETYQLLIYASRDVQTDPHAKQIIEVKPNKEYKILYDLPYSPKFPKSFHVWLFTTAFIDSTHSRVQTLLAWGKMPTDILLMSNPDTIPSFRLIDNDEDVKQQTQGLITVLLSNITDRDFFIEKIPQRDLTGLKMVPDEYVSDSSTLAIKHIENAYAHYRCEPSLQYFSFIRTPIGKLPLISFPLLGCNDLSYVDSEAEALFNRWFYYAGIILGHTDDHKVQNLRFQQLNDADRMEWLSEMVTLVARALMYRNDTVRLTGDRFKFVDQWVRLGSFPDLELAAFDCEDAGEYSLELLSVLQKLKISNSSPCLLYLQQLLSHYTIFLAIGQINLDPFSNKKPPRYTAHAFVICLDSTYIEDLIKDESMRFLSRTPDARLFYPSVIIDPTNYQESVWNNLNTRNIIANNNEQMQDLFNMPAFTSSDNKLWEYTIHSKVSMSDVKKHAIYGPLTALLTTSISNPRQYQKKQSMHLLFFNTVKGNDQKPSIGIKIDELMNYRPRSKGLQVFIASTVNREKSNEEDRQLLIDMQGLPSVSLPVVKNITIMQNPVIGNIRKQHDSKFYFIRYSDYMIPEYKITIHKAIDQFCMRYKINDKPIIQIWELGNNLKLVVVILSVV